MKSRQCTQATAESDLTNTVRVKVEPDQDEQRMIMSLRQFLDPLRIQKVYKLKHVLIPPSKIKAPKKVLLLKKPKTSKTKDSLLFDVDKKRDFFSRHETFIKDLYAKNPNISEKGLYVVLSGHTPSITPELCKYIRYRMREISATLFRHPQYHPVRSIMHQEYLSTLLKEQPNMLKYQIISRVIQHFPNDAISKELVQRYLTNMPQFDKTRKKTPLREAAFSQNEFKQKRQPLPSFSKVNVFFSEEKQAQHIALPERQSSVHNYHHQQQQQQQYHHHHHHHHRHHRTPPPEAQKLVHQSIPLSTEEEEEEEEVDPKFEKDSLWKYELPEDMTRGSIAPLKKSEYSYLITYIKNNPIMTRKQYAHELMTHFPALQEKMTAGQLHNYMSVKLKDVIRMIKEPTGNILNELTTAQTEFIKNQLRDDCSKDLHQIFIALATEFPERSTTFNYFTVKKCVNRIVPHEYRKRQPKMYLNDLQNYHKAFLDTIYKRLPHMKATKAYSDMLRAFPDAFVSWAPATRYINCMNIVKTTKQKEQ